MNNRADSFNNFLIFLRYVIPTKDFSHVNQKFNLVNSVAVVEDFSGLMAGSILCIHASVRCYPVPDKSILCCLASEDITVILAYTFEIVDIVEVVPPGDC